MKRRFNSKKVKFLQKAGTSVLSVLIVVALVIGLFPNHVMAATADLDTSTKYKESLGDNASTEYAGRIWTDKSVYNKDVSFDIFTPEGEAQRSTTITIGGEGAEDEDFLVAYSALATAESIEGQTQAPVDVVLILDISGSMSNADSNMDNNKSRIYNTVQAANEAIDKLMAMNPYTRVAVVAFSSNAQVLLPLDRYTKQTVTEWQQVSGRWQRVEITKDYFSLSNDKASSNYATLYTNAVNSENDVIDKSTSVEGGTNIQMGLYEGMQILAEEESTTVMIDGTEVQRIPSVILLSDGSPTYSSDSKSWWAPEDNYNDGPGSAPYAGNGMKAILVGSYMKDAIDRNYKVAGTAFATTVYTVGMGITGLPDNEKNLAYMTLDPGTYWNDTDVTNSMKTTIKDYWDKYIKDSNTGTLNINVGKYDNGYKDDYYALTHPTTGYDVNPEIGYDYVDIYYNADNASAVTDVFNQIVSNISLAVPQVPTEIKGADPGTDGYITYTDPLGEYMEVKDVKSILYAGAEFKQKSVSKEGNITTYIFEGHVDSPIYGQQEIEKIIIQVVSEKSEGETFAKETLIVKIPAAVIPIRVNEIKLNKDGSVKSHTNNGAYPVRVIYSVGLQEGIKKTSDNDEEYIDTSVLSAEYLAANTDEDGNINFYSNLFTGLNQDHGHSVGDTTVEFEPAHNNQFYYIVEDMPIYKDRNLNNIVTSEDGLDNDKIYYYEELFYHGNSVEKKVIERTGEQLRASGIEIDETGKLYRKAGSPRLMRMREFSGHKVNNATNTAEDFYVPTFHIEEGSTNAYDGKIVVYLGNNGLLSLPSGGNLQITKDVNAAQGLTAPEKEFEFTLDLNGEDVSEGVFRYVIVNQNGEQLSEGTVSKTNPKITLKDGQTATVYSLPPGTAYTVVETEVAGFAVEFEGASGTIVAGATNVAAFTNTYNVTPVTFPTEGTLKGTKELVGREWDDKDSFTFYLRPFNNAPLPVDYNAETGVTVSAPDAVDSQIATFDFGTIEYTKPGIYRYTIDEKEPENDEYLPGMTYSGAVYRVVIEVVDNEDGTLSIESADIQKLFTDDAEQLFTYNENNEIVMNAGQEGQDAIKFVNTYKADSVIRIPEAQKIYTDHSGMNPLVSGMFSFQLSAVGYMIDDGTLITDVSMVPMPESAVNGVCVVANEGTNVTFPQIEYTQSLIPNNADKITFRYEMSEVVPEDKVNGMTYDNNKYTIDVVVSLDASSSILNVNAIYPEGKNIVSFTNEYKQNPVTVDIKGTKTLNGRDMKAGEAFEFEIMGANEATNKAVQDQTIVVPSSFVTVTGGKEGEATAFAFNNIEFKKAGTYEFLVQEHKGDNPSPSVEYDESVVNVTVVIDDADKDGNLEMTSITYSNGKEEAEFTNVYTTQFDGTPVSLDGRKTLTGKTLKKSEFFFNVEEYFNGNKVTEGLVSNEADVDADENGVYEGTVSFLKDRTYTEAGTYEYIITEQIPDPKVGGTTYDESKYRFTVVVEDQDANGNKEVGKLTVTSTKLEKMDGNIWNTVSSVVFSNEYVPTPKAYAVPVMKKALLGNRAEALEAGEFKFELSLKDASPADGIELPEQTVVTNDADGNIVFKDITFKKAGIYTVAVKEVIPEDKAAGMTYSEQEFTVTYTVTDDRTGNLTVTAVQNENTNVFENQYIAKPAEVKIQIAKELQGRNWKNGDKFDFEIVMQDTDTLRAVENRDIEFPIDEEAGTYTAQSIESENETITGTIKINTPGTYKFILREITGTIPGVNYDSHGREVVIIATDDSKNAKIDVAVTIDGKESQMSNGVHKVKFTNIYDAKSTKLPGHDHLKITKNFNGRTEDQWLDSDEFKFVLAAGDDKTKAAVDNKIVELPKETTLIVSNANRNYPHFGDIMFHEAGTYTFTVEELEGDIPGVTYDSKVHKITVEVVDNGQGELVASVKEGSDDLVFNNTYSTEPVTLEGAANLQIKKSLVGRDWFEEDQFTFQIRPSGETTAQAVANEDIVMPDETITIKAGTDKKADQTESFGDIIFKKAGNYRFTISEINGDIENMKYDAHTYDVFVSVTDNNKGQLVTEVTYLGSNVFVNTYKPTAVIVPFEALKDLDGRELKANEFTFRINALTEAAPMPERTVVKNGVDTDVTAVDFGSAAFTEAGTYEYVITETRGLLDGVTYDTGKVTVKVEVSYNSSNGQLTLESVTYTKTDAKDNVLASEGEESYTFNNSFMGSPGKLVGETDLKVTKNFTGRVDNEWLDKDVFTFELTAYDEITKAAEEAGKIILPEKTLSISKNNNENAYFGDITFTEPGTYTFSVTEKSGSLPGVTYDTTTRIITVVVENTGAPVLRVTKKDSSDTLTFDNEYDAKSVKVAFEATKELTGRELKADEFTFKIKNAEGEVLRTETNDITGKVRFAEFTFVRVGTYTYTVYEELGDLGGVTYDDAVYEVTVTVTDDTVGNLVASTEIKKADEAVNSMTFANTYKPAEVNVNLNLSGTKSVVNDKNESAEWAGKEFTFYLQKYVDGKWTTIAKDTATQDQPAVNFSLDETYTEAGVYEYQVVETNHGLTIDGITYDSVMHTFNVSVSDNGKGRLVAEVKSSHGTNEGSHFHFDNGVWENDDVDFTNVNNQGQTSILIMIQKTLDNASGSDQVSREGFVFEVYETDAQYSENNRTLITETEHTDLSGETYFAKTYKYEDAGKEYYYILKEKDMGMPGMDYSDKEYKFKVVVSADSQTGMVMAEIIADISTPFGTFESGVVRDITETVDTEDTTSGVTYPLAAFKNVYNPEDTQVSFTAEKVLEGRDLAAGEFSFELKNAAGKVLDVKQNDADGKVTFKTLTFDTVGTYKYTVNEVVGTLGGVTYDNRVYEVVVTVRDNGEGQLVASIAGVDVEEPYEVGTFTNTYNTEGTSVVLSAEKDLKGRQCHLDKDDIK